VLSHRFARRVVDEVMARLGHNVNLMDTSGVILASGDRRRLGVVHAGALRAVREARTVVVTAADAAVLAGSKPGVNVPIRVGGETVGVVGVSGPPDRVRVAAASVALTVELMLAQEASDEEWQWRHRASTQLLEDVVTGRVSPPEWRHRLDLADCTARPPYLLLALALTGSPQLRTLRHHLDAAGSAVLVALDVDDVVWMLAGGGGHDIAHAHMRRLRQILHSQQVGGRLVEGGTASDLAGLARLAARVRRATRCSWQGDRTLSELELPVLLAALDEDTRSDLQDRVLDGLSDSQLRTLRVFLDSDLVLSRAARRLGIHRNTVIQRLDVITHRCGRDPRRFADAATLHAALILRDAG
jgi:carbohydrate diacid regulator